MCSLISFGFWIGGKAKPLKQPKSDKKEYDEVLVYAIDFTCFVYFGNMIVGSAFIGV